MRTTDDISSDIKTCDQRSARLMKDYSALVGKGDKSPGTTERLENLETGMHRCDSERAELDAEFREAQTHEIRAGLDSGKYATEAGADLGSRGPTLTKSRGRVSDPWVRDVGNLDPVELRDFAISALARCEERTEHPVPIDPAARERIGVAIERADGGDEACEWSIIASDPNYATAFTSLLRDPATAHRSWSEAEVTAYRRAREFAQRSSMQETSTHGSELVPLMIDPMIRLVNVGSRNDIRSVATIYSTSTAVWNGVTSTGSDAEWVAELAETTNASPTFTAPQITAYKADCYVEASLEMLQDTTLTNQLGLLFSDARLRLEDSAFSSGSGSGQPTGIITTLAATTASRVSAVTNASFGALDCFALAQQLPSRYQANASWLANPNMSLEIRKFALSSGNVSSAFWQDLGGGTPANLLGYPLNFATGMVSTLSTATASSDYALTIGDWTNYIITDRVGSFMQTTPVVVGSNRRPIGATGFVMWWRVGAKLINADAARVLVV